VGCDSFTVRSDALAAQNAKAFFSAVVAHSASRIATNPPVAAGGALSRQAVCDRVGQDDPVASKNGTQLRTYLDEFVPI
jgi:hypothetical protein